MESQIFDIAFSDGEQSFTGWVNPSDKLNAEGRPVSFHVVLNDVSFGYLSYSNAGWKANETRPHHLIELVGMQIEKYYSSLESTKMHGTAN